MIVLPIGFSQQHTGVACVSSCVGDGPAEQVDSRPCMYHRHSHRSLLCSSSVVFCFCCVPLQGACVLL
jgi:hypothetical protein